MYYLLHYDSSYIVIETDNDTVVASSKLWELSIDDAILRFQAKQHTGNWDSLQSLRNHFTFIAESPTPFKTPFLNYYPEWGI